MCVDNAFEAVELATSEDFDVILMDTHVWHRTDWKPLAGSARCRSPRCLVPVVAVSAQAFADQIEICRLAGMDTHLPKPFSRGTLLATVGLIGQASRHAMVMPALPVIPRHGTDTEPLVFDRDAFDDSTEVLTAEEVELQLRTMIDRGEALYAQAACAQYRNSRRRTGRCGACPRRRCEHARLPRPWASPGAGLRLQPSRWRG